MAEEKPKPEMDKEISGKYKMKKGFAPGKYSFKGGTIDFTNCGMQEADEAYKQKIGVIELIKQEADKSGTADKKV